MNPPNDDDRAHGLRLLDEGKPDEAIEALRRALKRDAHDVAALGGLAAALYRAGRFREAVARMRQRVRLQPDVPGFHHDLGLALSRLDEVGDAITAFERALALAPGFVAAHVDLADLLFRRGSTVAAEPHYRRAIELDATWSVPRANLAALMLTGGRIDDALVLYREALERDPTDVEAANGLGSALIESGRPVEAVERLQAASMAAPHHVRTKLNLGRALRLSGEVAAATRVHRELTDTVPTDADGWDELAQDLLAVDDFDAAIAASRRAVAAAPRRALLHAHLGNVLADAAQPTKAIAAYRDALRLKPDLAIARWNLALAELTVGDFARGWKDYEARWDCADFPSPRRRFDAPRLARLADAVGRTVLVHAEQGLGDTIQFVRLVPALAAAGARTVLAVPDALVRLFEDRGDFGHVIPLDTPSPSIDFHVPLMSLPLLLGRVEPEGKTVPYLRWQTVGRRVDLDPANGSNAAIARRRRIGIAWSGATTHANDRRRSLPLTSVASLLARVDVEWIGLQKDIRPTDVEPFDALCVANPGLAQSTTAVDFAATADVIDTLDLVIAVDTSVAHLAGAMGRPVWILLPFAPDFRWMLDRDDSPWYPTARLFRCPAPDRWDAVVDAVARALTDRTMDIARPTA